MDKQQVIFLGWQVWCWACGVLAIIRMLFGSRKPRLTDEERWQIFHELTSTPQLMADRKTYQKIEWRYAAYEPEAEQQAALRARPTIGVRGQTLPH